MSETIRTPFADIKHNTKAKLGSLSRYNRAVKGPLLRDAFRLGLDMIGQVSVADFMITTGTGELRNRPQAVGLKTHPTKLTMRSGRLAASMIGAFRFSNTTLPRSLKSFQARKFQGADLGSGEQESIREVRVIGKNIIATIGTKVKSPRGFDYPLYHEEKAPRLRQFLRPAVDKALPSVKRMLKQAIERDFVLRRI